MLTEGVVPSIHVDYKRSKIKQYHKLGQALRTETTINDAHKASPWASGSRISPLSARSASPPAGASWRCNETSCDCAIGEDAFAQVCAPITVDGQRGPALRFGDPRVQALLSVLVVFRLLPRRVLEPRPTRTPRALAGAHPEM